MRGPFPWRPLLAYLEPRLTPGVERVEGERYVRRLAGGEVAVALAPEGGSLSVSIAPGLPVADALADGKVVVLLFAEKNAADDQATARHFTTLSQLGSGVKTFRAGISDVGRYAGIVAQLGVTQAPSIVIVRPDLKAVPPIEGYVESQYLLQRVKDQLR